MGFLPDNVQDVKWGNYGCEVRRCCVSGLVGLPMWELR
jgi:hypothetical protein